MNKGLTLSTAELSLTTLMSCLQSALSFLSGEHIFRIAVIVLSCVLFLLVVVNGLLFWRQRRMLSDKTNASDGSSCNQQDTSRTKAKSEPGLAMEISSRISDGHPRGQPEYQGLQDNNEPKGYSNLDLQGNKKEKDEDGLDPIGGSWV